MKNNNLLHQQSGIINLTNSPLADDSQYNKEKEDTILNFYYIQQTPSINIVTLMNLIAFGGPVNKKMSLFYIKKTDEIKDSS